MAGSNTQAVVLIIDDDAEIRYSLQRVLGSRDYKVLAAASGEEGLVVAKEHMPHVIFLDNRMEGMTGIETLQHLRGISQNYMVILMTAFGTTQTAIEAMKFGAFDYIIKPFDIEKVLGLAEGAAKAHADLQSVGDSEPAEEYSLENDEEGIVGSSESMQFVFKTIGQVAASEITVMITGESGTGKELVSRAIWRHSYRSKKSFMAVNCAAIPDNLIESELFGHEKGAFTGATNQRRGKFELCDGGTLFLDEIGDMSLTTQTKILRALQEGEIQRVGGSDTIKVDVRLIAATNKDLETMVREKTFREDLYYRLNVVRIKLPSLRERLNDVPELVNFILQRLSRDGKSRVKHVSSEAMETLRTYPWPGNVRELENVVQRSAVVAQGETILVKDLPVEITMRQADNLQQQNPASNTSEPAEEPTPAPQQVAAPIVSGPPSPSATDAPLGAVPMETGEISHEKSLDIVYRNMRKKLDEAMLQDLEREMIQRALIEMKGNQVRTAALLGITRATLRKRIDQFSLRY